MAPVEPRTTDAGPCPECDFDASEWNEADTRHTIDVADAIVHYAIEGADPTVVDHLTERALRAARDRPDVHGLHALYHTLVEIDAVRRTAGEVSKVQHGRVVALNRSGGGVPKLPVERAAVTRRGLDGDRQRNRRHHGRPIQALCLFSADVIAALRAEGHTIHHGAAGENVTIEGIDWSKLRSGLVVEIGAVTARLTTPATPCGHNNQWFADHDSRRISHERHPGWSRWYASVITPGEIATGDPVTLR